ncbi:hypothetical protein GOP47_0012875 [Adiantum capillus-veneris]|uniref:C3H1-type domain-containing protein n=1 Tax=Adiantum capillus-veneris TaxID=13818 RepID=A0A9D4URH9_ADICA|nr:hypothetical protein GOP47_0012875 [Adiantum capillus-veneris]
MASLYQTGGSSASYAGLAPPLVAAGGATATSASYAPAAAYVADPLSVYGSYTPMAPPGVSWQQIDPFFSNLKRPGDEVLYSGDALSKRARLDMAPTLSIYPQRPCEKDCVYYMRTRTCNFGANCKFDHPAWVPAGGIPDWKEGSTTAPIIQALPVREGEPDCAFYMKTGSCKFGSNCKFNHPESSSTIAIDPKLADNADENPKCAFGSGNADISTALLKPATAFNAKGLPLRIGETDCPFYMKTGSCKFGSACRFNHPENPANVVLQQNQTPIAPLLGSLTAPYGSYSIFSGAIPDYGFSLPGADFGLSSLAQTSIYPQRPGEPSCTYYIKTGICKFASSCKFHHPVDRKEPSTKITLAGFPRREGEQACPFYMKTGTCKYALNCKFDHPPPGEAAAKALAEAGKSELPEVGEMPWCTISPLL